MFHSSVLYFEVWSDLSKGSNIVAWEYTATLTIGRHESTWYSFVTTET